MFERDPLMEEMVRLRRWDDGAKVVGVEGSTPRAERYWGMVVECLEGAGL
jgi:2-amino-1-hydroxyethylphosphonate dioxygenase (glycine-forming)